MRRISPAYLHHRVSSHAHFLNVLFLQHFICFLAVGSSASKELVVSNTGVEHVWLSAHSHLNHIFSRSECVEEENTIYPVTFGREEPRICVPLKSISDELLRHTEFFGSRHTGPSQNWHLH